MVTMRLLWMLDTVPGLREADCSEGWSEAGEACGYSEGGEITDPGDEVMVIWSIMVIGHLDQGL